MFFQMKPDPLGVPRNPLAVFLMFLTALSGAVQFFGLIVARAAAEALPFPVQLGWAFLLLSGGLSSLLGMFWPGDVRTGLTLKRMGMFALAGASFIYAAILVITVGLGGIFAAGVVTGFGFSCLLQYRSIVRRIDTIIEAS